MDSAQDSLDKTTIVSPLDGTITKLNSQLGERVLGTVQNAGTEIMIISDLSEMEARVDIGEMDIVLLQTGQKAKLEVDSFKDRKFAGVVTDVGQFIGRTGRQFVAGAVRQQFVLQRPGSDAVSGAHPRHGKRTISPRHVRERRQLKPARAPMSLAVPIASVTTRVSIKAKIRRGNTKPANQFRPGQPMPRPAAQTNSTKADKKTDDKNKPVDVVFVVEGDHVKWCRSKSASATTIIGRSPTA